MTHLRRTVRTLTAAALLSPFAGHALAEAVTFDFADPKGVNAVLFKLDSKLEPIVGMATGLTGSISFDPADPMSFKGSLSLPANQVTCSNARMTAVLHGADWINAGENPLVTFTFDEVVSVEKEDDETELNVAGSLTVAGQTVPITVEIEVDHLVDAAKDRGGAKEGDLLVLRSDFSIKRSDFGIKLDSSTDVVADEIELDVAVVGYSK